MRRAVPVISTSWRPDFLAPPFLQALTDSPEIESQAPQARFEHQHFLLFLEPVGRILPSDQTIAKVGHDRAWTWTRIGHLRANLVDTSVLAGSSLLGR